MEINQYDIVLVNLDPTCGRETKKTQPCVIVSPNEMNKYLNAVVIAPMTSQSKLYPTRVRINRENINSWVVLDQIRTIDKQRIIEILDFLTNTEIGNVKKILKETFVD